MMKWLRLVAVCVVAVCLSAPAAMAASEWRSKVDPAVLKQLDEQAGAAQAAKRSPFGRGDVVHVIVTLASDESGGVPPLAPSRRGADTKASLLTRMRRFHSGARKELLRAFQAQPARKEAENRLREGYTGELWLADAVAMDVPLSRIAELASRKEVQWIEKDREVRLGPVTDEDASPTPSAEAFGGGALRWTPSLEVLGVPRIRKEYGLDGTGVVVGHIDSGCDAGHPNLAGKILMFKDIITGETTPSDSVGHGTHTAGTIVGGAAGGIAIGVAPGARLIVAKVSSSSGVTMGSWMLAAMQWMTDPDENPATDDAPRVVNNSLGLGSNSPSYRRAVERWRELGIFPCFSAGNSGPDPATMAKPAAYPEAFAIGATDDDDQATSFSSRGPAHVDGKEIVKPDVCAPGYHVLSSIPGGGYGYKSGTSMACPHVCGTVALMLQADPNLDVEAIEQILRETAVDLGPAGRDNTYGWGRVNAWKAVSCALDGGRLLLAVVDDAGSALAGAQVAIDEKEVVRCDGEGRLARWMIPGEHTIRVSCYGYEDAQENVEVRKGGILRLTLALKPASTRKVAFVVESAVDGEPVPRGEVQIETNASPLAYEFEEGRLELDLPGGRVSYEIHAFGFEPAGGHVRSDGPAEVRVRMKPIPCVLVMDDDGLEHCERYTAETLAELGIPCDIHTRRREDTPIPEELEAYEVVIWCTGVQQFTRALDAEETEFMRSHLESGGLLILNGQDAVHSLDEEAHEMLRRMKARFVRDATFSFSLLGSGILEGFKCSINAEGSAANQEYMDVLAADDGSEVILEYGEKEGAAVMCKGASGMPGAVLMGFGLEGLAPAHRRILLGKLMEAADIERRIRRRLHLLPPGLLSSYAAARRGMTRPSPQANE